MVTLNQASRLPAENLIGLDARDAADIAWLAAILPPLVTDEEATDGFQPDDSSLFNHFADSSEAAPTGKGGKKPDEDKDNEGDPSPEEQSKVPVHAGDPSSDAQPSSMPSQTTMPISIPAANALPQQLKLGNSLRPLKARIDSRTHFALDELLTAEMTAEYQFAKRFIPYFRPEQERWFDLCFIVDMTTPMEIWRETAIEFARLLTNSGAFRHVYGYRINVEENGELEMRTGLSGQGQLCNPKEIKAFSGRRIALVMSDCTHDFWYDGKARVLLDYWCEIIPTSIVQPLPPTLWYSTALAHSDFNYVYTQSPATPNSHLTIEHLDEWFEEGEPPTGNPIPVFSLSPANVQRWSKMTVGQGHYRFRGYYLPQKRLLAPVCKEKSVDTRWREFCSIATPTAQQLAGFLAAAPLWLPVIRLVQHVMLRQSNQSHLAEVLRSDLFKPRRTEPSKANGEIYFEFQDGMRDHLLKRIFQIDRLIILDQVSRHIESHHGQWASFRAWLKDPTQLKIDESLIHSSNKIGKQFAAVVVEVIRSIGSAYQEEVSQMMELMKKIATRTYIKHWVFSPYHTRPKVQNDEWWNKCFYPFPAIASFVNAPFSAAIVSRPSGGKTTAIQALSMHSDFAAIIVDYHPRYWPGNADERAIGKQHFSQVMAAIGLKLIELLAIESSRFSNLAEHEYEFFVWMLHHYLGGRQLIRLGRQLRQLEEFDHDLLERVPELYPEINTSRSRREQLEEVSFLVQSLGYKRLFVAIDLNVEEFWTHQKNVELFFQDGYLFQSNIIAMRFALPQAAIDQGYLYKVSEQNRFSIFYLNYPDSDIQSILKAHLSASLIPFTLEQLCPSKLKDRVKMNILENYQWDSLGGWLTWLDTISYYRLNTQTKENDWEALIRAHYAKHYLLRLDPRRQGVWQGPIFKKLTGMPYEILSLLFQYQGNLQLDSLIEHAGTRENLQTVIRRIRQMIEPVQKNPVYIHTDNVAGYWLESAVF